jgi:ABC-type multidrug transport system fused ATPase/permease subunit
MTEASDSELIAQASAREQMRLALRALWPQRFVVVSALVLHMAAVAVEGVAIVSLATLMTELLDVEGSAVDNNEVLALPGRILGALHISVTATSIFGFILVMLVAKLVLRTIAVVAETDVWTRFTKRRSDELAIAYARADWRYLTGRRSGDFLNVMIRELPAGSGMVRATVAFAGASISAAVYITFAILVSAAAVGLFLGTFAIVLLVMWPLLRYLRRFATDLVQINSRLAQRYQELLSGSKVTKSLVAEERVHAQVQGDTSTARGLFMRTGALGEITAATEIGIVLAVFVLLILHVTDLASAVNAGVTGAILLRVSQRVQSAFGMVGQITLGLPSLGVVLGTINDLKKNKERTGGETLEGHFETLRFGNVSYGYGEGHTVISGIEFEVRKGEFLGIVGESGAGKTTSVDLLLGLLNPTGGQILVNGAPLDQADMADWRRHIGYVPQETVLFHDTVYNNIAAYRDQVSEDDVKWAAEIAQASGFIEEFDQQYDHVVGERGVRISGGQRQRLALARALASRPEILLLDEATSSLDNRAESEFQEALDNIRSQLTIIAIAHRLSTVIRADRVIVLAEGRIVEIGAPQDLLAIKGGHFQRLQAMQTSDSR